MKILLDTSAYVGFKRNFFEVVEIITSAKTVLFSSIVLGELMFGFRNGQKFNQNMSELILFLQHDAVTILQAGEITADRYSRIASQLRSQGTPRHTWPHTRGAQIPSLVGLLVMPCTGTGGGGIGPSPSRARARAMLSPPAYSSSSLRGLEQMRLWRSSARRRAWRSALRPSSCARAR